MNELCELAHLDRRGFCDVFSVDAAGARDLRQARSPARAARSLRHNLLKRLTKMRRHLLGVFAQVEALEFRNQAVITRAEFVPLLVDFDLRVVAVKKVVPLLFRILLEWLFDVEESRLDERVQIVTTHVERWKTDWAFCTGLGLIHQCIDIDLGAATESLALGTHARGIVE